MPVLRAKNMTVVKDKYGVFKLAHYGGGFAQYTYLPEVNVIKIPDILSFHDAAAISMVGMTSWHMLVTRANRSLISDPLVR
jgi:NADPH:quinone reductase-like Zn-dependent oxidoreductase